jgi:hypothetical protein
MANCAYCGVLFEAKRADARYCSDKCRVTANRNKSDRLNVTPVTDNVTDKPANFGMDNCECRHCRAVKSNKSNHILNHGQYKPAGELAPGELNRVALPGDVDYVGIQEA